MGDKPAGNAYESSMLPRTAERAEEGHANYAPPRTPERYRRSAAREAAAPAREGLSATDIDNFLDQFAATARKQALENGVPAGIALAYGIEELKRGQRIDSWDEPLFQILCQQSALGAGPGPLLPLLRAAIDEQSAAFQPGS